MKAIVTITPDLAIVEGTARFKAPASWEEGGPSRERFSLSFSLIYNYSRAACTWWKAEGTVQANASLLPKWASIFLVTFCSFLNLGFMSYFLYVFINIIFLGIQSLTYSYPRGRS